MKKKLVIKFWKAERALAMQILEQEGLPKRKTFGCVQSGTSPMLYEQVIGIRDCYKKDDWFIGSILFDSNQDRDEYLDKITQAITDELFTSDGELKVGERCEVRDFDDDEWCKSELIAVLPDQYTQRYIAKTGNSKDCWLCWEQARPIAKRTEPKVETNGEIVTYTWEE